MTRTNTIGETISAHDGHEDLPRDPTAEDAQEVAAVRAPVAVATSDAERAALIDLIEEHLYGVYHCGRVWEAWQVGTMHESDFTEARGSDLAPDLADAILAKRPALPIDFKQATDQGGWQPEAIADRVVRTVGEMGDRNSPEDWPEAMLVTGEELHAIILQAFEQEAEAAHPCAPVESGWQPIATAPKDGTPIIIADIGEGQVYDTVHGWFEVLTEDEEDGPWSLDGGEPHCSYVGRAEGTYFCSWLPGKELDRCWRVAESFGYTHWQLCPAAPTFLGVADGDAVGGKSGGAA